MSFTPPKVHPGDVVLWHGEAGDAGTPAIVVKLSSRDGRMLDMVALSGRTFMSRVSIRHEDDPVLRKAETASDGNWSVTKGAKDIEDRLRILEGAANRAATAKAK